MSQNQLDTLIRMLNQIAVNNGAYPTDEAATRVAEHVKRFWARSMKQSIIAYTENHQEDELSPVARLALSKLAAG